LNILRKDKNSPQRKKDSPQGQKDAPHGLAAPEGVKHKEHKVKEKEFYSCALYDGSS
jgi:hypothetical protein